MRRGFSLVEVTVGFLILQIGILAVFGMILLSQRSFQRAELIMRGVLEFVLFVDSLFLSGSYGSGSRDLSWGEISWSEESMPVQGLRFFLWSQTQGDTLVRLCRPEPLPDPSPAFPYPSPGGIP